MTLVVIESPYKGHSMWPWPFRILGRWLDRLRNIQYARECMHDAIRRGEAPFASHLLYTQRGILQDGNTWQRALGIRAGLAWGAKAEKVLVYVDRGITEGMRQGIKEAEARGQEVLYMSLAEWTEMKSPVE